MIILINIKLSPVSDSATSRPPAEIFPAGVPPAGRLLTWADFHRLADVPPEVAWFANLTNPQTRRAYETTVKDFMRFTGIAKPEEFRSVTLRHRGHVRSRSLAAASWPSWSRSHQVKSFPNAVG